MSNKIVKQSDMSGHSKWSKIKRAKGKEDQKRGQEFSKLARAITVAVIDGKSGDAGQNSALRLAVEKAKQANMPKTNIKRAIEKGQGRGSGGKVETVIFEGYGPGGVALMVEVGTDNRQRTAAQIKNLFDRFGGAMASPGAAAYMFERDGTGMRAKSQIEINDADKTKVRGLIESLQNHEDVTGVAHSAKL